MVELWVSHSSQSNLGKIGDIAVISTSTGNTGTLIGEVEDVPMTTVGQSVYLLIRPKEGEANREKGSTSSAQYATKHDWRRAEATQCGAYHDGLRPSTSSVFARKKRPAGGRRTGWRAKNVGGRFRTWRRRLDRTLPSSAHIRPARKTSMYRNNLFFCWFNIHWCAR